MSYVIRIAAGTLALGLSFPGIAAAQETTLNVLYNLPGFTRFHQPIAEEFEKLHPHIKINFLAPAVDYGAGHQQILRSVVTGDAPDVFFSGYQLLPELARTLVERDQISDLSPFIEAEGGQAFLNENFSPALAALGLVDGVQYSLPVNASSPIVYFNADLVREAGGDPDNFPDTWAGAVELAAKIKATGENIAGMSYDVATFPDDWLWQALLYQQGIELIDPETGALGFEGETGLDMLKLVRSFVTEGGQSVLDWDQSRQQFGAGLTGFIVSTPAHVQTIEGLVGDRFELRTTTFPLDDKEKGGLPVGGNGIVILTQDEARQQAAWEYAKFVTGPQAQDIVVRITGYLPTNLRATGEDYLAPYYRENPNVATAARQADKSWPYAGYPGGDSVRIWRTQRDIIGTVQRGEVSPEEGLKQIVEQTKALID